MLITGGTGSFGKKFIETISAMYPAIKKIIFSRDELKLSDLKQKYPSSTYLNLRFFMDDVRDPESWEGIGKLFKKLLGRIQR